ncbi:MAG: hypothetical protein U0411_12020 [Thermodesulfovibrionales bacterium]
MDVADKIKKFIEFEKRSAGICRDLSALFNGAAEELFSALSREEEGHAVILEHALACFKAGDLSPELFAFLSPQIDETLDLAGTMERRLASKELTLPEALELMLAMERSVAEKYRVGYLVDMSFGKGGLAISNEFAKVVCERGCHVARIKAFMQNGQQRAKEF